jgi:pimeloyl-ACP methyl ester carboxylesterase
MVFVLIPGAGGNASYWQLLAPELRSRGHDVVAVDLPAADDRAGLREYAEAVVDAIGGRPGVRLVAQSLGGLTAPLVCGRVPVDEIILVNAMIPAPGETGGDWWANTGQGEAQRDLDRREGRDPDAAFDPLVCFFHDVPADVTEIAMAEPVPQSDTPFDEPWPLDGWPDVPTRVLSSADDRLFPYDFQVRVAQERLGITPERIPGGHLVALSRPKDLADAIDAQA